MLALHVPSPGGLGFLKHGSLLRLRGNGKASYSLALEVREYHFHHILLAKSPAQIQAGECWGLWVTGGRGNLFGV